MKRVLLYGISNKEMRCNVISYLDEDFEIIGITDKYISEDRCLLHNKST